MSLNINVRATLVFCFCFLFSPLTFGYDLTDNLKVGGSIRERFEYKQDFNFRDSNQSYLLSRLRAHAELQLSNSLLALLELQHAQVDGAKISEAPSINRHATPNIYADKLDIHRAFLEYTFDGGKLTAGRQKLNLGDLRLVSSLEWVNTARVFDAIRFTLGDTSTRLYDVFISRHVAVKPDSFNDWARVGNRYADSDFHGLYITDHTLFSNSEIRAYWFYRHNHAFKDKVHTLGAHHTATYNTFETLLQGAFQFGDFGGKDHLAYMLNAGGSYAFDPYKLELTYHFASGHNQRNSTKHRTFDNLYPLNHRYYGYMDLFALQNIHNLHLAFEGSAPLNGKFYIAYEGFWLADSHDSWYNAGLGVVRTANPTASVSSHVGDEIDVTLKYKFFENRLVFIGGYSHFFTGNYVSDTGTSKDANFYFLQASYKV